MTNIIAVTLMILAAVVLTVFPCFAEGVIYGCYQKNQGQLRIVSGPNSCTPSEVSIYWNQTGPQGPQGTAGPPGPAGIEVYDANNVFLGYSLLFPTESLTVPVVSPIPTPVIHIPKLDLQITIDLGSGCVLAGTGGVPFFCIPLQTVRARLMASR
jgi:hypothetical protein